MKELLETMAKGLVEHPEAVEVTVDEPDETGLVVYHLHVAESDMGGLSASRDVLPKPSASVMRAAATRVDGKVAVEID